MTTTNIGRLALSACATAILAACGQSATVPNIAPLVGNEAAPSARADANGCPTRRCIIVTSQRGFGKPHGAVLFFTEDANGNKSPAGELTGSKTRLGFPTGLAMDSRHDIYVSNGYPPSITVYAAGSQGNVAPIRTITGNKTQLNHPAGIAIDPRDELYVANNQGTHYRITVYASDANGNAAPIREIRGKKTELYSPWGIAFDSQSKLYVANDDPNTGWITVYDSGAKGNATPERTIRGSATKLAGPAGLAVNASGYIYVVDSMAEAVSIFSPEANGNEAPISYFSAPIYALGLALDKQSTMYITSVGYDDAPYIDVFAGGPTRKAGHILRTIEGRKTKLNLPQGIIVR
jgi:hypothetical protein